MFCRLRFKCRFYQLSFESGCRLGAHAALFQKKQCRKTRVFFHVFIGLTLYAWWRSSPLVALVPLAQAKFDEQ